MVTAWSSLLLFYWNKENVVSLEHRARLKAFLFVAKARLGRSKAGRGVNTSMYLREFASAAFIRAAEQGQPTPASSAAPALLDCGGRGSPRSVYL